MLLYMTYVLNKELGNGLNRKQQKMISRVHTNHNTSVPYLYKLKYMGGGEMHLQCSNVFRIEPSFVYLTFSVDCCQVSSKRVCNI